MNEELQELIETGRVEEALARVRLTGSGPRAGLEALADIRNWLRARLYQKALEELAGHRQAVAEVVDADELERALSEIAEERFEDWLEDPLVGAEAWLQKGLLAVAEGDLRGGRDCFAEATRRDPRHWRAWTNLGNAELELGNLEAAEKAYEEARKRNENYPEVYQGIAALAKRRGQIDRMVKNLKLAQKKRLTPRDEQLPGAVLPPRRPGLRSLLDTRVRWALWIVLILLAYWWTHR
ncbi:tetratricopeptide repeat protein [Oceanithermus sp.]